MKIIYSFLLTLMFLAPLGVNAQLIQWQDSRPLTWIDFKGEVNEGIHHDALTHCLFNYNFHWDKHNGLYTFSFKIKSGFDSQTSWCRPGKQADMLLKHEQLHFDIHELYARKLYQAFNSCSYTDNYKEELKKIFDRMLIEAQAMQDEYDADTNHSRDKSKQLEWEVKIKEELRNMPLYISI